MKTKWSVRGAVGAAVCVLSCGSGSGSGQGGTTTTGTLTGGSGASVTTSSGGDSSTSTGTLGGGGTTSAIGGTTTNGGTGGTGGSGGCTYTFTCGLKDCGLVDSGCEPVWDCGGCGDQLAGQDQNGPMMCGPDHKCLCIPEGDSPTALAKCTTEPNPANPPVPQWCKDHGGCTTAYCGMPPVPKIPDTCRYAGQLSGESLWCCIAP